MRTWMPLAVKAGVLLVCVLAFVSCQWISSLSNYIEFGDTRFRPVTAVLELEWDDSPYAFEINLLFLSRGLDYDAATGEIDGRRSLAHPARDHR